MRREYEDLDVQEVEKRRKSGERIKN